MKNRTSTEQEVVDAARNHYFYRAFRRPQQIWVWDNRDNNTGHWEKVQ